VHSGAPVLHFVFGESYENLGKYSSIIGKRKGTEFENRGNNLSINNPIKVVVW
jgi:hypothetical protein